jgi:hypothetical protein
MRFRVRFTFSQVVSDLSDEKNSQSNNGPVFIQPSTGTTGGSNPTPRTTNDAQTEMDGSEPQLILGFR